MKRLFFMAITGYEITDTGAGSFQIKQKLDGVVVQTQNYAKGSATTEVNQDHINIVIIKDSNEYRVANDLLVLPVNDGSINDIYNKLQTILF